MSIVITETKDNELIILSVLSQMTVEKVRKRDVRVQVMFSRDRGELDRYEKGFYYRQAASTLLLLWLPLSSLIRFEINFTWLGMRT